MLSRDEYIAEWEAEQRALIRLGWRCWIGDGVLGTLTILGSHVHLAFVSSLYWIVVLVPVLVVSVAPWGGALYATFKANEATGIIWRESYTEPWRIGRRKSAPVYIREDLD